MCFAIFYFLCPENWLEILLNFIVKVRITYFYSTCEKFFSIKRNEYQVSPTITIYPIFLIFYVFFFLIYEYNVIATIWQFKQRHSGNHCLNNLYTIIMKRITFIILYLNLSGSNIPLRSTEGNYQKMIYSIDLD